MPMIPIQDVIPEFLPYVEGCPNPVAIRQFRNTLMDFCRRSEAWHYRDDFVPTIEGLGELELPLPDDTRLIKVLSMTYDGRLMHPASEQVLDHQVHDWRNDVGCPRAWFEMSGSRVRLYPTPERTDVGRLQATYALSPTRNSKEVDDDFFEEWTEGLIAGVLHRLRMMPNQPWSDAQMAQVDLANYEKAVEHAARYARNDHQHKGCRVTAYGGY